MAETTYTIVRQAIAGAGGGLATFMLLEPHQLAAESVPHSHLLQQDIGTALAALLGNALLLGTVMGGCISAALVFGDELGTGRLGRIAGRTGLALLAGSLIGAVTGLAAQFLFSLLLVVGLLIAARSLGWALLGAGMGVAGGAITLSGAKVRQGAAGGAVGGFVGGGLFDIIGFITQQGTASRLVGFAVTGICIGIAAAMAREIAKRAWVTVLTGRGEGTRYLIDKPQVAIGRAELADIPLFGDPSIDRTQAVITAAEGGYMVQDVGAAPQLRVDGQPVASTWLRDGMDLELGRHRLRFSARMGAAVHSLDPPWPATVEPSPLETARALEASPGWAPAPPPAPDEPHAPAWPGSAPPIRLRAEEGPHAGATFPVPPGRCTIGRAPENAIALADGMVSRQHAEIFPDGEGWVIRDLGSRNGTAVNGEQVNEAWINPGDEVRIGTGAYRVELEA